MGLSDFASKVRISVTPPSGACSVRKDGSRRRRQWPPSTRVVQNDPHTVRLSILLRCGYAPTWSIDCPADPRPLPKNSEIGPNRVDVGPRTSWAPRRHANHIASCPDPRQCKYFRPKMHDLGRRRFYSPIDVTKYARFAQAYKLLLLMPSPNA
jgi:hypothetical protein